MSPQVWYSVFSCIRVSSLVCNRIPEDEPSGSKHVEDSKTLKIKILIWKRYILLVCIIIVVFIVVSVEKKNNFEQLINRSGIFFWGGGATAPSGPWLPHYV
jgi:hypothetical protein